MTPRPRSLACILLSLAVGLTTALGTLSVTTTTATAAEPSATRTITLTPSKAGYVSKSSAKKVYNKKSTLLASKAVYATYLEFPAVKLKPGESITSATLQVHVTGLTGKKKAKLVVVPVKKGWAANKLTYKKRPKATAGKVNTVGTVQAKKTAKISLSPNKVAKAISAGSAFRLTNGLANTSIKIAGKGAKAPKLIVKVARQGSSVSAPRPLPTTPAPTTDPSTSPTPTKAPSTSPTPAPVTSTKVGSVPVGAANYPAPAGALYVSPKGTSTGSGTKADPYGSLETALKKASSGATIVLRGGTYHESVEVPFYKKLVIQSYPGEAVWFDGASTLGNWTASGKTWSTGWNYAFDHKVSFSQGKDETSWWVNPKYPMAGYPEQLWIDGAAQTQVSTVGGVTAGTFFVDTAAKRLVIGTNPAGKKVEASTLQKAITVHGAGSTLRGFGIKRYATTMYQFGAISVEVDDVSMENMVVTQNATIGLFSWGQRANFNKLTLTRNGSLGAGISGSAGVKVQNSDVSFNNAERFNEAPVAAGIKTSKVTDSTFVNNLFEGNLDSAGLWIDEKGKNLSIAGNRFTGNGRDGLGLEISVNIRVVNNIADKNGGSGIRVFDSQYVEVWNNTVVNNVRDSLRIMQDDGRPGRWDILYLNKAVNLRNNVVSFGTTGCPLVVMDIMSKFTGAEMGTSFKGNVYHRGSTSAPNTFICWADGKAGMAQYKSLSAFRAATGQDAQSVELIGASIVTGDHKLTAAAKSAADAAPVPVTQQVADLMGVKAGWKGVGAAPPKLER